MVCSIRFFLVLKQFCIVINFHFIALKSNCNAKKIRSLASHLMNCRLTNSTMAVPIHFLLGYSSLNANVFRVVPMGSL